MMNKETTVEELPDGSVKPAEEPVHWFCGVLAAYSGR